MRLKRVQTGRVLQAAGSTLAAVFAVLLFGVCFVAPAHAQIPIMHNSSSTGSTYWSGGWGNTPNSKYGQFTCSTCHNAGLSGGNAKQIKSTITTPNGSNWASTGTPNATVVFASYTTYGADRLTRSTSNRICEVCHSQTLHHRYNNTVGATLHQGDVDCFTCHSHSNGFKKPSCTSCHGNPPTTATLATNGQSGNTGLVNPATNGTASLNPGAHGTHNTRFPNDCTVCHNGNTMPTISNTIQMGFNGFNGRVTAGTFTGYTTLNGEAFVSSSVGTSVLRRTSATNPTCSNLYCHGSTLTAGTKTTPLWTGGSTEAACGTCHGATSTAPPTTGIHVKHAGTAAGYTFACTKCHAKVTDNSHVKGNVFWRLSTGSTLIPSGATYKGFRNSSTNSLAPSASYGSCANLYCHSKGDGANTPYVTPSWTTGTTIGCDGCHGNSTGNIISTETHQRHVNPASSGTIIIGTNNGLGCVKCHAKTVSNDTTLLASKVTHVNGFKDYSGAYAYKAGYAGGAVANCTTYCHSNGNLGVTPVYQTPTQWYTGSTTGTCSLCHGNDPGGQFTSTIGAPNYASGGVAPNATANSHKKHTVDLGSVTTTVCANCHVKTVDATLANKFKDYSAAVYHINGTPTVVFQSKDNKTGTWSGTNPSTCTATYCHGTGTSPSWGSATLACNTCHSANAATTGSGIQRNWAGTGAQSAHKIHIDSTTAVPTSYFNYSGNVSSATQYRFACSVCHSPAAGAQHANGPVTTGVRAAQVFFGYTTNGIAGGTYTAGGSATGNDNGFNWTSGTGCNTTYCHSNGNGSNGLTAVFWNTTSSTKNGGNCIKCHGNSVASGTPIATGKHGSHINPATGSLLNTGNGLGCVQCHAKTVSNDTTIGNKLKHVNKFKDYSGVKAGSSARYNTTIAKSCNNIYCHSNGNPGNVVFVSMTGSKTWIGNATLGCNGCHGRSNTLYGAPDYANGAAPNLNSHSKHITVLGITNTTGCAKCHNRTVDATTASKYKAYSTMHLNGTPNVYIRPGYYGNGSDGTNNFSGGTCSNITCHSNNQGTYQNVTWGQTSNCRMCHPMNALTGGHRFHVYTSVTANTPTFYNNYTANRSNGAAAPGRYNFGCSICHPVANANHATGSGQVLLDLKPAAAGGSIKNKNSAAINQGAVVAGTSGSGTTTTSVPGSVVRCINIYCHSNGGNGVAVAFQAYTTPEWYTSSGKPTDSCAMCHGNWPNSARADGRVMLGSATHYNSNWLGTGAAGGHAMGIHSKKITNSSSFTGLLAAGGSGNVSHGLAAQATTISCNTCHSLTVTTGTNNGSALCTGCHTGAGNSNAVIFDKSKHVNGTVNVLFQSGTMTSKAQMRDASFSLNSSSTLWHRNGGYKAGATSYDTSKQNLNVANPYVSGANCANVSCHFNQLVKWTNPAPAVTCNSCHTKM